MAFALVFAALSFFTLVHELGHAAMARALGLHVTVLSVGFGPPFARFHVRGVEVLLCVVPFGGFVRVSELVDDEAAGPSTRVPLGRRLAVILAGSAANYALAAALGVALALGFGRETGRIEGLEITALSERAERAGLAVGDVIVRADEREVPSVQALQEIFAASRGAAVRLDVLRARAPRRIDAIAEPGRPGLGARYVPKPELVRDGALRAIAGGLTDPARRTASLIRNSYASIAERRAARASGPSARPASPIGLATRVAQSGRWDARRVLSFGALLTVVVGLFNLLPLPGLDGGRASLALAERALGRRLPRRTAFAIQLAGGLLLFAASVALALLDVFAR